MTQTPTPERLQDALRCIPLAIDNNKYIGCTGQHHKNFLKEFEQTIQFALRFTAETLAIREQVDAPPEFLEVLNENFLELLA